VTSWETHCLIWHWAGVHGWGTCVLRALSATLMVGICCAAQAQQQSVPLVAGVTRTEGTDSASGIAWVRFSLAAEGLSAADAAAWPALTVQCAQNGAKRNAELYFDFGGAERGFHAPPAPDPVTHFPPFFPPVTLKLDFPGYRPFKRQFETMPSGEFHYRPPGLGSANMEPVSFFLQYLYAVPVLRVSAINRKVSDKAAEFHTSGLMDAVRKTETCR